MYSLWSATSPAGPAAPHDPRVLAQQAIARMRLRAINIDIVPEPRAGSVAIIGMPTWMWAQNPSLNTWGPGHEVGVGGCVHRDGHREGRSGGLGHGGWVDGGLHRVGDGEPRLHMRNVEAIERASYPPRRSRSAS